MCEQGSSHANDDLQICGYGMGWELGGDTYRVENNGLDLAFAEIVALHV
jgi:hypothetical protein